MIQTHKVLYFKTAPPPPPPKNKNKKITLPHWESASPVGNRKKKIKIAEKLN